MSTRPSGCCRSIDFRVPKKRSILAFAVGILTGGSAISMPHSVRLGAMEGPSRLLALSGM